MQWAPCIGQHPSFNSGKWTIDPAQKRLLGLGSKMKYKLHPLLIMVIFHCQVSFQGGHYFLFKRWVWKHGTWDPWFMRSCEADWSLYWPMPTKTPVFLVNFCNIWILAQSKQIKMDGGSSHCSGMWGENSLEVSMNFILTNHLALLMKEILPAKMENISMSIAYYTCISSVNSIILCGACRAASATGSWSVCKATRAALPRGTRSIQKIYSWWSGWQIFVVNLSIEEKMKTARFTHHPYRFSNNCNWLTGWFSFPQFSKFKFQLA